MIDVAAYALKKPGAVETYPFGPEYTVIKVGGKMFALMPAVKRPGHVNLKCDPVRAPWLRREHPEITPGYHMNKDHWNTLDLTRSLSDDLVRELIDHSYELVAPKKR